MSQGICPESSCPAAGPNMACPASAHSAGATWLPGLSASLPSRSPTRRTTWGSLCRPRAESNLFPPNAVSIALTTPPAPSWPGRRGGSRAERRPSLSVGCSAAGPAGGADLRPLLLGLARRAVTLGFPRSGAEPPAPRGRPSVSRARDDWGSSGGRDFSLPASGPARPPLALIFVRCGTSPGY